MNYHNVHYEASFGTAEQLPLSTGPEIVFSGRSNVGKSSLINKLFNQKNLARVSGQPGKTSTINFFRMEGVRFVDMPGYGYAKVSRSEKERWRRLIRAYLSGDRDIRLIFQLIDMRHPPTKDDLDMIHSLMDAELPFVVVLTKQDKLNKREWSERWEAFRTEIPQGDEITMIPFSAVSGDGVETLKEIIEEVTGEEE